MSKPEEMWQCQMTNCGYIYDPAHGDKKGKIPKGTRFEDLPEDWKCPCCGVQQGACSSRWPARVRWRNRRSNAPSEARRGGAETEVAGTKINRRAGPMIRSSGLGSPEKIDLPW